MGLGGMLNRLLGHLNMRLVRTDGPRKATARNVFDLDPQIDDGLDRNTRRVLNVVEYTKTSGSDYDASDFESGYHSIAIGDRTFRGQRNPSERLDGVPFNFEGATVLDIGCNQGGMLFEIEDRVRFGIGIDFDHRMINAANLIRSVKPAKNLNFFVFDVQNESLDLLPNLLPEAKVDIIFLLSVCMWIDNWQELIATCVQLSDTILFESNGTDEQQFAQERFIKSVYRKVELLRDRSTDDPNQARRRLYLCKN